MNHPPALPSTLETFSGLDLRETRFVVEYVSRSGRKGAGADSALAAGYSNNNRDAAHSMASRLLRRPAILSAIKGELGRRMTSAAVLGVSVLEQLATSAASEQVRLGAAKELVDRGYGPIVSRNTSVVANTSLEELWARLDSQEAANTQPPVLDGRLVSSSVQPSRDAAPAEVEYDEADYYEAEHPWECVEDDDDGPE